jgi:hypothetical protein
MGRMVAGKALVGNQVDKAFQNGKAASILHESGLNNSAFN